MAGEETAPEEVLVSPTFETQGNWSAGYELAIQSDGGVIVGPGIGNPNVFAQTFSTWWGAQYRITTTASALGNDPTTAVVQVNWLTGGNDLAGVTKHTFVVDGEPVTVTYHIEAPFNAASGTIYVVPGEADQAVRYTEISAARIDPVRDFRDYRFFGFAGPHAIAIVIGVIAGLIILAVGLRRWGRQLADWLPSTAPFFRIAFPAFAVLACVLMVLRMEPFFERNYDAQYHQVLVDVTARWSEPSLDFGGNPLSSFGIQAPINTSIIPSFLIGQFADPDMRIPVEAAVQAFLLLLLAACSLRASGAGVAEAFAIGLVAMAFFWVPPLTSGAVPFDATLGLVWSESALATFLALICFVRIGAGSARSTIAWSAGLLATILWYVLALPYNLPFFVMATAFVCAGAAMGSGTLREFVTKGVASLAILAILVAAGVPTFAIDLFSYTPQMYFETLGEAYAQGHWPPRLSSLITMIILAPERAMGIAVFLGFAVLGTVAALRQGNANARRFAFAGLGLVVLANTAGFANSVLGILPMLFFYIEQTGVAIITVLAGVGVWGVLGVVGMGIASATSIALRRRDTPAHRAGNDARAQLRLSQALPFAAVVAGSVFLLSQPVPPLDLGWPPRGDSAAARIQIEALAVEPGDLFRGRSLTLMGMRVPGPLKWARFYAPLYAYLLEFGSDLMVDARYDGVPVVNEYGHWISPPALALLAAGFYDPQDFVDRAAQAPKVYRANLARLMGVSLVVSDAPIDGETLLYEGKAGDHPIHVSRVAGPNLGQYSPTRVVVADDAAAILDQLQSPDFDGSKLAVIEEPIEQTLVPASDVAVRLERGPALRVSGVSAGVSLLVLPFDWSHCLQATGPGLVELVPVNLAQTGMLIRGSASIEIRYRFGLIAGTDCRRKDRQRIEGLGLDEAAGGRLFSLRTPSESSAGD